MNIKRSITKRLIKILGTLGLEARKESPDFYLHEYSSYEEYKETQIFHNKRKLQNIFADEDTLNLVINRVKNEFSTSSELFCLCHGTRNGFEQNYIASQLKVEIIGTDISETANQFPKSIQWDFHDRKEEWVERCDFIYTNSLDQSWKPRSAVSTWLDQLQKGGLLFIEHTEAHTPQGASKMDPFGANPYYIPYLLCEWFQHRIAIEIIKSVKSNFDIKAWIFVIKKL